MSVLIYPKDSQAQGAFDGGSIRENKPIGFVQDGGEQKPYSSLFYWAHAFSDPGGLIGEHLHKGFEIMSFVLTGEIEHYDSNLKGWKKLKAGDVQIIRAGNGITHAEKMNAGSSIFQIWFDPDLSKSLAKEASYDDYKSELFPINKDEESSTKILFGEGSPIRMDSIVGYIKEITLTVSAKTFVLDKDYIYSFYILNGSLVFNKKEMKQGDFAIVKQEEKMDFFKIQKDTRMFIIKTPIEPGFLTYAKRAGWTNQ